MILAYINFRQVVSGDRKRFVSNRIRSREQDVERGVRNLYLARGRDFLRQTKQLLLEGGCTSSDIMGTKRKASDEDGVADSSHGYATV